MINIETVSSLKKASQRIIVELCAQPGRSYSSLAEDLNLSKTHLYSIANDPDRPVDQDTLFKIANYLNIPYRIVFENIPDK